MELLNEEVRGEIKRRLEVLPSDVKLVFFKQNLDCPTCEVVESLVRELASLSSRLKLEIHNRATEEEKAKEYGIDKAPALVLEGSAGNRVRFYGLPSGYEFASLLEAIKEASFGITELSEPTKKNLASLKAPIHIQVFVTPHCPYCPSAVRTAHKLALAFPNITADMVEAEEFPELSMKFGVSGVPKIIINETGGFDGARPESAFVSAILETAGAVN